MHILEIANNAKLINLIFAIPKNNKIKNILKKDRTR